MKLPAAAEHRLGKHHRALRCPAAQPPLPPAATAVDITPPPPARAVHAAVVAAPAAAAAVDGTTALRITAIKCFAASIPTAASQGPIWNQCLVKVEAEPEVGGFACVCTLVELSAHFLTCKL